jgi:acyl carrier protein
MSDTGPSATPSTLARVAALITARFPDAAGRVGPAMTADDVKGWNSLSHAMLLMDVERAFGVEIPAEAGLDLETVGDLVSLLDSLDSEKARP